MRAFRGHALGAIDDFALEVVGQPRPGPGQLRIRVEAVGLGFVDALVMRGLYQIKPPLPFVPGGEIVGVVEEAGDAVDGFARGQRIAAWQFGGGLADEVIVNGEDAVAVPDGVESTAAAAVLLDYLTAYYGLFDRGVLKPGEVVLVTGASGGVGSAAVQLASATGCKVAALASCAEKLDYVRGLGAAVALDYRDPDWRTQLKGAFAEGMGIVFDPVGGPVFEPAFRSLAKRGRHLVVGFAAGTRIPSLPANLVLLKSGELVGVDARYLWHSDKPRVRALLSILLDLVRTNHLKPRIAEIIPLGEAERAFIALADNTRLGKVVVQP